MSVVTKAASDSSSRQQQQQVQLYRRRTNCFRDNRCFIYGCCYPGTGVVTSVPTDSPDDFTNLQALKTKFSYYKNLYGLKEEWVMPFEAIEIIDVPG